MVEAHLNAPSQYAVEYFAAVPYVLVYFMVVPRIMVDPRRRHGCAHHRPGLSAPGWQECFERITVYQRGWLLGGKGASTRGVSGRIEEHGLHLWSGAYDNAFALVRDVYAELDRESSSSTSS